MTEISPTAPPMKSCRHCGYERPLDHFRRLRRDSDKRVATCRTCRRVKDRVREAKQHDAARYRELSQSLEALAKCSSQRRCLTFLDAMMRQFGGPREFAAELHRCYGFTTDRRLKFRILRMMVDAMLATENQRSQTA